MQVPSGKAKKLSFNHHLFDKIDFRMNRKPLFHNHQHKGKDLHQHKAVEDDIAGNLLRVGKIGRFDIDKYTVGRKRLKLKPEYLRVYDMGTNDDFVHSVGYT